MNDQGRPTRVAAAPFLCAHGEPVGWLLAATREDLILDRGAVKSRGEQGRAGGVSPRVRPSASQEIQATRQLTQPARHLVSSQGAGSPPGIRHNPLLHPLIAGHLTRGPCLSTLEFSYRYPVADARHSPDFGWLKCCPWPPCPPFPRNPSCRSEAPP
jgi:hypothetical protein